MSTRVNVVNRTVLTVLGLVFIGAGVLGLVLSLGGFGQRRATAAVLPEQWRSYAATQSWFWWAVAGGCLLVALLGLRWLLAQLRTDRTSRLDLTIDERDGVSLLHAGALTDAASAEAEDIPGVEKATAHITDHPRRVLTLVVNLTASANIGQVRSQLLGTSVPHVREALDEPELAINVELRPTSSTRRTVA